MAITTDATAAFIQAVTLDQQQAAQLANQALQTNNQAAAQLQIDRMNRDAALLGNPPVGAPSWYVYPANFNDVPVLQLPAGVYAPTSLPSALAATVQTAAAVASSPAPASTTPTAQVTRAPGGSTVTARPGQASPKEVAVGPGGGFGIDWSLYCAEYPDDPLCSFIGGPQSSGGGGTTVNETTVVVENVGLDAPTVNTLLDGALSSLWSTIISGIDAVIAAAIAALQAALTAIANALKAAFQVLAHLVGDVLNFLKSLFSRIIHTIVDALQKLLQLLGDLWSKILKPALQWLQKIRSKILEIYERFIRPVLIIIQRLRQVLAILKLFHVKFAQKLDTWLADLERRITEPLFYLLHYTNAIGNFINLILTAGYLIQKPLWLNSLNAYKGSTIGLQINAMSNPVSGADITALQQQQALPTTQASSQAWQQYTTTGTGPIQPLADQQTAQLQAYLQGGV